MRIIVKPAKMEHLHKVTIYKKKSHHHADLLFVNTDGLLFYISNESDEIVIQLNDDPKLTFIVIKQEPRQLTQPMDLTDRIKVELEDTLGNQVNREFLRSLYLRNIYDDERTKLKLEESFGKYVTGSLNPILVITTDDFSTDELNDNIRYRYDPYGNILNIDQSILKDVMDLWDRIPENKAHVKPVIFDTLNME